MFEFLIALFGGAYYGGKYLDDYSKNKSYERKKNVRDAKLEDIKTKYEASYYIRSWALEYIQSGEHFDEICEMFEEDIKYALGVDDWKNKLEIPHGYRVNHEFLYPELHGYWIYHLLLASKGKMDFWTICHGLDIGGQDIKYMNVRFAERIEYQLHKAGANDIELALELETTCGKSRTPYEPCRGHIKIESLCVLPTCKMW